MANELTWIQKAFDLSTGRDAAALPPEEKMKLIQTLYKAHAQADERGTRTDGIGRAQLHKAIIDVLDTQSHTPEFKRRIDAALDNLAMNKTRRIDPVLAFIAYWDRLNKSEKKEFVRGAVDMMETSLKREFPFLRELSIQTAFPRFTAMVQNDLFTGESDYRMPPVVVHPRSLSARGDWELTVNTHKGSGFEDGLLMMRETVWAGIHIIQHQLRYNYMKGRFNPNPNMPYQLYEDSENIFGLSGIVLPHDNALKRSTDEAFFINRYAKERSQEFADLLKNMIEERKDALRLPPSESVLSRIAGALHLKK